MHTKKHTKKTLSRRKHRGGYYGAAGPIKGTVGAMEWSNHQEVAVPTYAKGGRRRKTKGKKTMKKSRKGGNRFGATSASFQGKGINGLATYEQTSTKSGPSAFGAFNDNGAKPGSSFP